MSTLTSYELYDLVNRPHPLWLVRVDLSNAPLYWIDLSGCNLSMATLGKGGFELGQPGGSNAGENQLSHGEPVRGAFAKSQFDRSRIDQGEPDACGFGKGGYDRGRGR